MGRTSGYIALYTGIGGGAEDILIPEAPMEIQKLVAKLDAQHKAGKKSSIIVIAEGETAGGAARDKISDRKGHQLGYQGQRAWSCTTGRRPFRV